MVAAVVFAVSMMSVPLSRLELLLYWKSTRRHVSSVCVCGCKCIFFFFILFGSDAVVACGDSVVPRVICGTVTSRLSCILLSPVAARDVLCRFHLIFLHVTMHTCCIRAKYACRPQSANQMRHTERCMKFCRIWFSFLLWKCSLLRSGQESIKNPRTVKLRTNSIDSGAVNDSEFEFEFLF